MYWEIKTITSTDLISAFTNCEFCGPSPPINTPSRFPPLQRRLMLQVVEKPNIFRAGLQGVLQRFFVISFKPQNHIEIKENLDIMV